MGARATLASTTPRVPALAALALLAALAVALAGCKPKTVGDAEAKGDVRWLASDGSPQAVAALGRLADRDPSAVRELEGRAAQDVNTYIAAWAAVTRGAAWGGALLRTALGDPTRADVAATALPRRDARLAPFAQDLEGAVVRLSAGRRGSVVAGVLASVGPAAHAQVERRLIDPKTRGAMCDGLALPEASGDAKSLVLAVKPEARDHASCVDVILAMAATEDAVLGWLGVSAEPGLVGATAKGQLACPRLATLWAKALAERTPETHAGLAVPLQLALKRCGAALDPVVADALIATPRARPLVLHGIDAYSTELADLKLTCKALRGSWVNGESVRVRERADDALAHGCKFAR
jgi:hypothetical protein